MTKLKAFVRLDFMTVKPYFTMKTMLIYAVVALFLTAVSENISSGMGVGMMLGTMFMGYPFALGEKSNMDALYATLSVSRKNVVLGRYVFALLLNVCTILFSFGLGMAGLLATKVFGLTIGVGGTFAVVIALSSLFIIIQSIQLPLYFKLGYSKAKFLSIIPFAALMISYLSILTLQNISSGLSSFLTSVMDSGMAIPLLFVLLLLIIFVSYRISLVFYEKREF